MSVQVGILFGSPSDRGMMAPAGVVLEKFGIDFEMESMSAHRQPGLVNEYVTSAESRGLRVLIAGAGRSAHLPGLVASLTPLPVIGVPLSGGVMGGMDALLSVVQMPSGVPVACVAIDASSNAGLLAVQIIATGDDDLRKKLHEYKQQLAEGLRL